MSNRLGASLVMVGLLAGFGTAVAQTASPEPGTPPVDCAPTSSFLVPAIDGLALDATTTTGIVAIDPDELLDPLLLSLGRTRDDVCLVVFSYGTVDDDIGGQLLRIVGIETPDLAGRFVAAMRDRLGAYGATTTPSLLNIDDQTVWSLEAVAEGQTTRILAWQRGDTLLLTSGLPQMERLLSSVVIEVVPSPSTVSASPSG